MSVMQDKKAGLKDSKKGAKKEKVGDPPITAPGCSHPPCHTACLPTAKLSGLSAIAHFA